MIKLVFTSYYIEIIIKFPYPNEYVKFVDEILGFFLRIVLAYKRILYGVGDIVELG